jgi:hypothetical protein
MNLKCGAPGRLDAYRAWDFDVQHLIYGACAVNVRLGNAIFIIQAFQVCIAFVADDIKGSLAGYTRYY